MLVSGSYVCWLVTLYDFLPSYVFRRMSIRRSNRLMARLEEAAAEEEALQVRGRGRGHGRPPLRGGALGARGRGAGAPPPLPEGPEAEAEHGEAK
jgi:hypothetical protein